MQVTQTVDIAAPPQRVWEVLVDVEGWPGWTESMREVTLLDGRPLSEGSRVRIAQPLLPKVEWVVTEVVPGRSFSWAAHGPGVVSVADHEVSPARDGSRVTLRLSQNGPLSTALGVLTSRLTQRYVATEAVGLKHRCESPTAPG